MDIKSFVREAPLLSDLVKLKRFTKRKLRKVQTFKAMQAYLKGPGLKNWQFGSGSNALAGWFNTDYDIVVEGVYHIDMREPLPFPSGSLDVVASEHCFEHFSYDTGKKILNECFRVLKPGGMLRFSTPDLMQFVKLFQNAAGETEQQFMTAFFKVTTMPHLKPVPCTTLNAAMREWGHLFLYDRATIHELMVECKFRDIRIVTPAEKHTLRLKAMEVRPNVGSNTLEAYETMIIEAMKPL